MKLHLSSVPRILVFLAWFPIIGHAADPKPDETFDFGQGSVGSEVGHDFHLVNAGPGPMTINEVKSSCSCTRIVAFPKTIAPGQSGVIAIATKLDQAGDKNVLVTALTDGKVTAHVFVIKGEIVAASRVNPDVFAEPKELMADPKSAVMYVDVRPNLDFNEARIPASINVPLFALRARTYLKAHSLVVVGSGIDDLALVSTVEACRKEGFTSMRIMRGGIRQWQQAGGRLEGVFSAQPPVGKITASQFLSSADHSGWLVLLPQGVKPVAKLNDAIQIKVMSYSDIGRVEDILKGALLNSDAQGVAIFTANDLDREKLSQTVPSLDRPLFMVAEPWTVFTSLASARNLEQNKSIKTVASGPLTHRIIGCPTCP